MHGYHHKVGALGGGNDLEEGDYTLLDAIAHAARMPACVGFTFCSPEAHPKGRLRVYFKRSADGNGDPGWQTYLKNLPGHHPGPGHGRGPGHHGPAHHGPAHHGRGPGGRGRGGHAPGHHAVAQATQAAQAAQAAMAAQAVQFQEAERRRQEEERRRAEEMRRIQLYQEACALRDKQRFQQAADAFDQCIRLGHHDPGLCHNERGQCFDELDQFPLAIQVSAVQPNSPAYSFAK